jgi:hypothetical protein
MNLPLAHRRRFIQEMFSQKRLAAAQNPGGAGGKKG